MYYEPFIGMAAVAVFEHNGYEVVVPDQNCCSLPMLNNGEFDAAGKLFDNNVAKAFRLRKARFADRGHDTQLHIDAQG